MALVAHCRDCPYRGRAIGPCGDSSADIVYIAEGPGVTELAMGTPFVGPSGGLLKKTAHKVGLPSSWTETTGPFVTNALCCKPPKKPGNSQPKKEVIVACRGRLIDEVFRAPDSPRKLVIIFGAVALKSVTDRYNAKITEERGKLFRAFDTDCIATLHPAHILRYPQEYGKFLRDLQTASDFYNRDERKSSGELRYTIATAENIGIIMYGLMHHNGKLAVDIETEGRVREDGKKASGLDRDAHIRCLGIAFAKNRVVVFPDEFIPRLKPLFARPSTEVQFIWHNGKFDRQFLRRDGIIMPDDSYLDALEARIELNRNRLPTLA